MRKVVLAILVSGMLAGCLDEDSKENSSDVLGKATTSQIASLVKETNLHGSYVYLTDSETYSPFNQVGIVRFDTTAQIPLYYVSENGSLPPEEIVKAYQQLEARLGDIFTDFIPVMADLTVYRDPLYTNQNRGNDTFNASEFNAIHSISTGLIVAEGTAFYSSEYSSNPQNMCGNASIAPYSGSLSISINPSTSLYASDTVLWLNMGNGQCSWDYQMVMHETAHNLGMFNHVDGYFGLWSETAMNMLATLYNNAGGSNYSDLVIDYQ